MSNNTIKLIAIDLDDTLLDKDKRISKENIEAIKYATSKGIKVVITTGRPYFRIINFLKTLDLYNEDSYVITYNGSLISNATGTNILRNVSLNNEDIVKISKTIDSLNLHFNVYVDDLIYSTEVIPFIQKQKVFDGIIFSICDFDTILNLKEAAKIIICDEEEKVTNNKEEVVKLLGNDYNVLRSTPIYLEILPKDANKGKALKYLMDYLNIESKEVMAIGDEENDLPMFAFVDYKISVENGNDILKQNATFVTKKHTDSGVAFVINKYIK